MSKYLPLKRHLEHAIGDEHPMTLGEIESILGFSLPASAREYPPFWSNTHQNPAVKAFRGAGWKSSRVDLAGQRIVFVRDSEPANNSRVSFDLSDLSPAARRFIEQGATQAGGVEGAVVKFLNREAPSSRKSLLERFAAKSPKLKTDSTPLIREDRDGR